MRLIDADALIGKDVGIAWVSTEAIRNASTIDAVHVVRCRECKNYVIVDEFEGGKRYMCLVNHFSYLDNDGDNQFCSYGERKGGAD